MKKTSRAAARDVSFLSEYVFQQPLKLRQGRDLIVGDNRPVVCLPVRIEPTGFDPRVEAAADVRGEAVAEDDRPLPLKAGDLPEAVFKEAFLRFVAVI